jgi:hypothetical protein
MSGWTRRRFLAAAAALAASGVAAERRVGWLVPAGGAPAAAENGLLLAQEEAERAATLLGVGALALVRVTGDPVRGLEEAQRAGAVAVLAAFGADALPAGDGRAVLAVLPARRAGGAGVLEVASSQAARGAALAAAAFAGAAARVVDWHPALERFGAAQLNERYERRFGAGMDEAAWAAWFAAKAVHEATLRAGRDAAAVRRALVTLAFDGHKGVPLRFDANGALAQPRYALGADGALLGEVRE